MANNVNFAELQFIDQCNQVTCFNQSRMIWPQLIVVRKVVAATVGNCPETFVSKGIELLRPDRVVTDRSVDEDYRFTFALLRIMKRNSVPDCDRLRRCLCQTIRSACNNAHSDEDEMQTTHSGSLMRAGPQLIRADARKRDFVA